MTNLIRLNRYIASQTTYSRRTIDDLISRGRVLVNGEPAALGTKVDIDAPGEITVNGKILGARPKQFTYIMLNKPRGYVVTRAHFKTEQSVMELLPSSLRHLKSVGRLDKSSEGALLFTDDGDLVQQLTHPSYQHEKEYLVGVKYALKESDLIAWSEGIELEEGNTGVNKSIEVLDDYTFQIVLKQGWNRQIRRMVEVRHNRVRDLRRLRVGNAKLGNLPLGQWRALQRDEITG